MDDNQKNSSELLKELLELRQQVKELEADAKKRRKTEDVVHQEKSLLRTLIDNLPDGIYVKDRDGRKVLSNSADLRNMGKKSEEEVLGKNDFELFPREIAKKFYEDDQQVIKTGVPVINREEYFINPEGEKRWLLTSKLPVKDESGNITGLLGLGRDITDLIKAQEILNEERTLLRTLIDSLPDLIFFKDSKGHYILNNKAHLKYLGAETQEEVVGKTTFDFNPLDVADKFNEEEMEIVRTGEPVIEKEENILYPELKEKFCHLTNKIPLKDDSGKVVGILGVSHNITNRKKAEEAIKKAYAELEETNKNLKKANKVKSQFLANMSHEIRTPLNAIIGMTGLLMDTKLDVEQRDFAETIYNSGDILLALINDILDFSKIEAQKIEIEKQPFDVRDCVEEALDIIASKAADKNIELVYSIDDGLSTNVVGDVTRVRQILVNLLGNAIKFTDEGEVEVSVSGQLRDHYVYQLHFSVRDTGIGIPLDRQDNVFQSFTQVDASTTRKFGGTGLGLTISRQLSELMGGTMWVESAGVPGEGTTFHFTILTEISVEREIETDNTELAGKKVLIVDDNQTNRNILDKQSESFQMIPTKVASGDEALDLIQQGNQFDLAILDYHMPEMDGVTLAEEIKKLPSGKKLPLILLSSYGYREKKIGFSKFAATLTKPIKLAQLYNAMVTVLCRITTHAAKEQPETPTRFDAEIGQMYPLSILLAEDNKINQKVALRFLEKIGYNADVAFNGIEAMKAFKRQTYDVVLMDVQMPEMDGEQCTIEIRKQIPAAQQPRIIAITANALSTDRDRYLSIGMDDYIVKPFKIEELVRALVESHIHLKQSGERQTVRES
jgi:two-component system sensor histidine kinase/response regulator